MRACICIGRSGHGPLTLDSLHCSHSNLTPIGMYRIASSDHIRAQSNPHMQDNAGRAESRNEAVNKLPHPLTLLKRDHLNMARTSPDVEQWRLGQSGWGVKAPTEQQVDNRATPETWGAPEGGNWGPIEEPEPGTIGLVRTGGDGQHNEGRVAIKLAGLSVARVNWNYLDEMLVSSDQLTCPTPDQSDLHLHSYLYRPTFSKLPLGPTFPT